MTRLADQLIDRYLGLTEDVSMNGKDINYAYLSPLPERTVIEFDSGPTFEKIRGEWEGDIAGQSFSHKELVDHIKKNNKLYYGKANVRVSKSKFRPFRESQDLDFESDSVIVTTKGPRIFISTKKDQSRMVTSAKHKDKLIQIKDKLSKVKDDRELYKLLKSVGIRDVQFSL